MSELKVDDNLKEKVERGAKLLDEKMPGWFEHINLDILKLSDCRWCTLGQLTGTYETGLSILFDDQNWNPMRKCANAIHHGFDVWEWNEANRFELTDLWKAEIICRLSIHQDLKTKVQRGAKLLDERMPGWFERVNLDTLKLSSCLDCVLGQLAGDFLEGVKLLWPNSKPEVEIWLGPYHGFEAYMGEYSHLKALWTIEITARRLAKKWELPSHEDQLKAYQNSLPNIQPGRLEAIAEAADNYLECQHA